MGKLEKLLEFGYCISSSRVRKVIRMIVDRELAVLSENSFYHSDVLYVFVGFTHSGKTYTIRHSKFLSNCFYIESRDIHNKLNKELECLRDDNTIFGRAYDLRQSLSLATRGALHYALRGRGEVVVADSAHLDLFTRQLGRICMYPRHTVIVHVHCAPVINMARAEAADNATPKGEEPPWVDLLTKQRLDYGDIVIPWWQADTIIKNYSDKGTLSLVKGDKKWLQKIQEK